MKILQVNSFYYNRGGDCTCMFQTTDLLRSHGNDVVHFSMQHPQNFPNKYSSYWPSYIDFREAVKDKSLKNFIKVINRTIYSFEAKKCISKFLDDVQPDIAHIHNILHHITPSILSEIKKRGIPIVWTLHDYTVICPNTSLLTDQGQVCQACKSNKFYMAPIKRCKKNSLSASLIAMLENYIHRVMRVYRHVDLFISPSDFLRQKFIEYGVKNNIVTLNNFVDTEKIKPKFSDKGYYLYIGRINHIKGVDILVEAAKMCPDVPLKVVGDGELLDEFRAMNLPHVEFTGFKQGEELTTLIAEAMFAVVPSQWFENFPYSVLEPMAMGKAVIGANMGGIPEQIEHGVNGYVFPHKDVTALSGYIKQLANNPALRVAMGREARARVEKLYSGSIYYEKLMNIYESVLQ